MDAGYFQRKRHALLFLLFSRTNVIFHQAGGRPINVARRTVAASYFGNHRLLRGILTRFPHLADQELVD